MRMKLIWKSLGVILFSLLLSCNKAVSKINTKDKRVVVGILPLEYKKGNDLIALKDSLEKNLSIRVHILRNKELIQSHFVNIKSPRYRADSIIRWIRRTKPDTIDYMIGITPKDISTTKKDKEGNIKKPESRYKDWGVFGLGFRPGNACVVSTYRLGNKKLERLSKVGMHELGHNFGLKHCDFNNTCVMQDAVETIKTVDRARAKFCSNCIDQLN
jgi:archaemetzincin